VERAGVGRAQVEVRGCTQAARPRTPPGKSGGAARSVGRQPLVGSHLRNYSRAIPRRARRQNSLDHQCSAAWAERAEVKAATALGMVEEVTAMGVAGRAAVVVAMVSVVAMAEVAMAMVGAVKVVMAMVGGATVASEPLQAVMARVEAVMARVEVMAMVEAAMVRVGAAGAQEGVPVLAVVAKVQEVAAMGWVATATVEVARAAAAEVRAAVEVKATVEAARGWVATATVEAAMVRKQEAGAKACIAEPHLRTKPGKNGRAARSVRRRPLVRSHLCTRSRTIPRRARRQNSLGHQCSAAWVARVEVAVMMGWVAVAKVMVGVVRELVEAAKEGRAAAMAVAATAQA